MSEPSVEFFLDRIENPHRWQFDQIRKWFDFRKSSGAPTPQTFTGVLAPDTEIRLHVPGVVYGYSGMSETTGGYWVPMTYSSTVQSGICYFALETENDDGSFVKIRSHSTNTSDFRYRATVMYRDA